MAEITASLLGPKAIEQLQKTVRETARRMRNEAPHRARWHGRPMDDVRPIEGLVLGCVGGGWWVIQLAEWNSQPDETGCYSDNTDNDDECDPCKILGLVPQNPNQACATEEVIINHKRPQGTGVYVFAHDTRRIPLLLGGHVRMLKSHLSDCGEQLYAIITGEYRMLKIAEPDYECCDGQVVQTGCKFYLVEGVECPIFESDCPS